jgi:anti-sigma factor RsiW
MHPSETALGLHILGDLSIFQKSSIEGHLDGCPRCRAARRRMQLVIDALRAIPSRQAPMGDENLSLAS